MPFFPLPYNVTSYPQLMLYNNTITNNMFGLGILAVVFFIPFITMLGFGQKQSLVTSLWFTTIMSIYLWTMQLVAPEVMVAMTVITALSTIFLFRTKEN